MKLKKCPFCGGLDLKIKGLKTEDDNSFYAYTVKCQDCHCEGRSHNPIGWVESEKEAYEAWNNRPDSINNILPAKYIKALEELGLEKGMSMENTLKQAIRIYQSIEVKSKDKEFLKAYTKLMNKDRLIKSKDYLGE